ncbi:MAG: NAD-dependent epimerase/dehydratase family protein, partial [Acidimicrobiia bacterium]
VADDPDARVGDITDPAAVATALLGVDAVCHQAAKVGLGVDFGDAVGYVTDNDLGTAVLLTALHDTRFRGPFVMASSMVVYGEGRYVCDRHGTVPAAPRRSTDLDAGNFEPPCPDCGASLRPESVPESAPTDPRNVYAATKLAQEHLAFAFAREHPDVCVTALRYHNVYGPGMPRDTPYAGVSAIFTDALVAGRAPQVFEDGGQLRDFVHVSDVARANLLALQLGAPGAFNVASGQPRRLLDMADALADAFGPTAPRPVVVGGWRAGDVRHVFASPQRAADVLGFTATVDFTDGMHQLARRDGSSAPTPTPDPQGF